VSVRYRTLGGHTALLSFPYRLTKFYEICIIDANLVSTGNYKIVIKYCELEMWANAQRDGRHAEYRWRPLFNAAKFG